MFPLDSVYSFESLNEHMNKKGTQSLPKLYFNTYELQYNFK